MNFSTKTLKESKNRGILCEESFIMVDKGYFKYEHYQRGLLDYKIVFLIYPRLNIKLKRIYSQFNHRLEDFKEKFDTNHIYKRLLAKLKNLLPQ